jgi:hypothetical protein
MLLNDAVASCQRMLCNLNYIMQHVSLTLGVIFMLVCHTSFPWLSSSVVGIVTRYGLDGPGIESLWGRDFQQPLRQTVGPTQPALQWVPGLFPGGG